MDYSYTVGDYSSVFDASGDGGGNVTDQEFYNTVLRQNDTIIAHQDKVIDGLQDNLDSLNAQKDILQQQLDNAKDLHVTQDGAIDYSSHFTAIEARLHNLQTINQDMLTNITETILFCFVAALVAYVFCKFLQNALRY